jgi:hypothetical protein
MTRNNVVSHNDLLGSQQKAMISIATCVKSSHIASNILPETPWAKIWLPLRDPFGDVSRSHLAVCVIESDWVLMREARTRTKKCEPTRTHFYFRIEPTSAAPHTNHTSPASRGHRAPWAPLCFWLQRHLTPNRSSTRSTQINLYDVFVAWTISKHQPSRNSKLYPGFILAKKFPTEIIIAIIL